MKKTELGTISYRYDSVNNLIVMRWNDNSAVTVAWNCLWVEPTICVSRWSEHHGRRIHVRQPNAICECNKNMGGVARNAHNVGCYRIHICSKKWWSGCLPTCLTYQFIMPGCCIVGLLQTLINPWHSFSSEYSWHVYTWCDTQQTRFSAVEVDMCSMWTSACQMKSDMIG